jgi:hypothetical protein
MSSSRNKASKGVRDPTRTLCRLCHSVPNPRATAATARPMINVKKEK